MTQGVAERMRPKDARSMLRIPLKKLAEMAKLSHVTVIESERGEKPIKLITAYALLDALNSVRLERGMEPLGIKDVEWNIGEK